MPVPSYTRLSGLGIGFAVAPRDAGFGHPSL